jgi:hypothetical protein
MFGFGLSQQTSEEVNQTNCLMENTGKNIGVSMQNMQKGA